MVECFAFGKSFFLQYDRINIAFYFEKIILGLLPIKCSCVSEYDGFGGTEDKDGRDWAGSFEYLWKNLTCCWVI